MSTRPKTNPNAAIPTNIIDLGDGEHALAECVDPTGISWPWILMKHAAAGSTEYDVPAHERLGALPREVLTALGRTCGAETRSGAPCRQIVDGFGQQCTQHSAKSARQTELF